MPFSVDMPTTKILNHSGVSENMPFGDKTWRHLRPRVELLVRCLATSGTTRQLLVRSHISPLPLRRSPFWRPAGPSTNVPEQGRTAAPKRYPCVFESYVSDHVHQFGSPQRNGVVIARLRNLALVPPLSRSISEGRRRGVQLNSADGFIKAMNNCHFFNHRDSNDTNRNNLSILATMSTYSAAITKVRS